MDAAAERFAGQGVGSIFLYTHEAHPGEHYPHLTSMEQKFRHALKLREVYGMERPILVDALDGACHRFYGGHPNMTWIINRTGTIHYKSNWTNASSVVDMLKYLLEDMPAQRKETGAGMSPFIVERLEYRPQDREKFDAGLKRAGQKAIDEFNKVFPK